MIFVLAYYFRKLSNEYLKVYGCSKSFQCWCMLLTMAYFVMWQFCSQILDLDSNEQVILSESEKLKFCVLLSSHVFEPYTLGSTPIR